MRPRRLALVTGVLLPAAFVVLIPDGVFGQSASAAQNRMTSKVKSGPAPKTPWGDPDLQGRYNHATATPMERPRAMAGKAELSDEELADVEARAFDQTNRDKRGQADGTVTDVNRAYNDFWNERGKPTKRTSLVIDPADGRVPALTAEAVVRAEAREAAQGRVKGTGMPGGRGEGVVDGTLGGVDGRGGRADTWEDRGLNERCIMWPTSGPPMMPTGYNSNYQIVQSPGYVAILVEMIHDVRLIPIDNRPHVGRDIRLWHGNSVGHWEGDTLVVETTNFSDKTAFRGASQNMRLVERFSRADAGALNYEFSVSDPSSFVAPWTARVPMRRIQEQLYEYACHEGNYGMYGILGGARALEQAAATKKGSR
jgi:hypothetical protein